MIPRGVEIFVALDPIDLRWGFDRLCGVVAEQLGRSARAGALFVFFGRRRTERAFAFSINASTQTRFGCQGLRSKATRLV
jgi:hypothetical protein